MDQKQIQICRWCQTINGPHKSWSDRYEAMQALVPYADQPDVQKALAYGLTNDRKGRAVGLVMDMQRDREIDIRRAVAKALARYADQPLPQRALACVLEEAYALEIRHEKAARHLAELRREKREACTYYADWKASVLLDGYADMMEHYDTFIYVMKTKKKK
jgi:hypothetical protein